MVRRGFGAVKSIRRKGVINPAKNFADRTSFYLFLGTAVGLALFVAPFAVQAFSRSEPEPVSDPSTIRPAANDNKTPQKAESSLELESDVKGTSTTETEVTVNGQEVPVPDNGSVHKEFKTSDGTTTVDVQNRSSSTGHSSSRLQLEID